MDPPPPLRKEHRQHGRDFSQVQGMNSQKRKFQQGVAGYGAQSRAEPER